MLRRRSLWSLSSLLLLVALADLRASAAPDAFVRLSGRHFELSGERYFVCGANLWYGAHLGRPSNPAGRARLGRELDQLVALGVNNLRVLGAAEACTTANALSPVIQTAPGELNEDVLQGLDYLVQEAGKRHLKLVVFLNNYWDWSGGMPQYLAWATHRPVVGLGQLPWKEFNRLQAKFYSNEDAQRLFRAYLQRIVARRNTLTGRVYRDEPAIMAWELANEPRPGESGDRAALMQTFVGWVDATSAYLHSLDANHLVTTGSEGAMGCLDSDDYFGRVHAVRGIDYAVFHLWPRNWKWYDPKRPAETMAMTLQRSRDYVARHLARCDTLGKPVVVEEFGLDRDGGLTLATPTSGRDRLFQQVFSQVEQSAAQGGSAAGTNFWLWGGEGRPPAATEAPDGIGAGDMPQEAPGLNTVFDADVSTIEVLRTHYRHLAAAASRPRETTPREN